MRMESNVWVRSAVALCIMIFFIPAVIWSIVLFTRGTFFSYTVVAFGDSLTADGSKWGGTNRSEPPSDKYNQGRWTNGFTWVEDVSSSLKSSLIDLACGGATTDNAIVFSNGSMSSFKDQATLFVTNNTQINKYTTTFMIWIGADDYNYIVEKNLNITPSQIVASIQSSIKLLIADGGQKFLLNNLFSLDITPGNQNLTADQKRKMQQLVTQHNSLLDTLAQNLTSSKLSVYAHVFDVNNTIQQIIANPTNFGFKNVTGPCLDNEDQCQNPDEYLWWDLSHITKNAHQVLADQITDYLKSGNGTCLFYGNCMI